MTGTCCDAINSHLIVVIPTPSEAEAEESASRLVPGSGEPPLDPGLWRLRAFFAHTTCLCADEDWIFSSPAQLGALPWSYPWLWRIFQKAAAAAQIGKLSTHTMRHTYRSWLTQ